MSALVTSLLVVFLSHSANRVVCDNDFRYVLWYLFLSRLLRFQRFLKIFLGNVFSCMLWTIQGRSVGDDKSRVGERQCWEGLCDVVRTYDRRQHLNTTAADRADSSATTTAHTSGHLQPHSTRPTSRSVMTDTGGSSDSIFGARGLRRS